MDIIKIEDLKNLVEKTEESCVSIYIPTHEKGEETGQDPIRLKNQLRKAENLLKEKGLKENEINQILKPAKILIDDIKFWQHQSKGLAIFLSKNSHYTYRLPYNFEELTVVYGGFNIKQLIPVLSSDEFFYILALDLKRSVLFKAGRYSINEIDLKDTPASLEEALKYNDPEKSIQFHTGTSQATVGQGTAGRSAIFHGHGGGVDDVKHKKDILEFFHLLERGVMKEIPGSNYPLVLIGVDYLVPIYKETNSYPYLEEKSIYHNPHDLSEMEIHNKAWDIIKQHFEEKFSEEVNIFREFSANGKSTDDLKGILEAAYSSRVRSLFLNIDEQQWGSFNPDTLDIRIDDRPLNGNIDLLDLAAIQTIIHNGVVYSLKTDKMPVSSKAAAVFRF
jgi:hypothetical protein